MNTFKNLVNLSEAAALLGIHPGDLLLAFFKAGMPSPLFDRDDIYDWAEKHCPEITDEAKLKEIYRELHAEGREPQIHDTGSARGILVWEDDDDD